MKLYEIEAELQKLYDAIEEAEGALDGEMERMLEELTLAKDVKVENILKLCKNEEARAKAIKEESDRLLKIRQSIENKIERLKWYLFACTGEGYKQDTALGTFSWRKSQVTEVLDMEQVPKEFIVEKVSVAVDKKLAKHVFLEEGKEIPGLAFPNNYNIALR